ncbi:apolipoprotein L3 [Scleropages formosus]|uniref:apolipoprotein L3 n=1 Tax=Scleropages formosus TaxID=113540 RepID=UPI0010FACAB9|nr:apolipoprotein L3-like [Scleropages formosus]
MGSSVLQKKLFNSIGSYTEETLSYIHVVKAFCSRKLKWFLQRERELQMLRDIKERADRLNLKFDHVKNSEGKGKAIKEYLWSKLTQITAEKKAQELEKELDAIIMESLKGLEKLQPFLEALEKLAVTSLFVFTEKNQLCLLPTGTSCTAVHSVISAARMACPLLVSFKKDMAELFLPDLVNVEAFAVELDKFIQVSKDLCERMEKGGKITYMPETKYDLNPDTVQAMLDHLSELNNIRVNQDFRLAFLFNSDAFRFIHLFSEHQDRMQQFLAQLEEGAVQLDRMKMGSNISSVVGSSVGLVGGVLSIVGLAIAPLTAGVSLTLTMVGVGLGVTSGVNSITTGVTELAVNAHQGEKVNGVFQSFMEDVETLLECLNQVANSRVMKMEPDKVDTVVGAGKVVVRTGVLAKSIDAIVDGTSALKILKTKEASGKAVLQEAGAARNLPNMASELADFGKAAKGTPLALSKSARAGFIALNSVFVGLDLFFICKDSINLAKGNKSDVSKIIRGRAWLWQSELDSWQRIHDSLCRGIRHFTKSSIILEKPFYCL